MKVGEFSRVVSHLDRPRLVLGSGSIQCTIIVPYVGKPTGIGAVQVA